MEDWSHRLALALLPAAGLLALLGAGPLPVEGVDLLHRQWLLAWVAAALLLAPWFAGLRLPAIAAGLVAKGGYIAAALAGNATVPVGAELLQMGLLLASGAILLAEARREARWNGMPQLRQEV